MRTEKHLEYQYDGVHGSLSSSFRCRNRSRDNNAKSSNENTAGKRTYESMKQSTKESLASSQRAIIVISLADHVIELIPPLGEPFWSVGHFAEITPCYLSPITRKFLKGSLLFLPVSWFHAWLIHSEAHVSQPEITNFRFDICSSYPRIAFLPPRKHIGRNDSMSPQI